MLQKFAVYNANIHTLNAAQPHAEAMGVMAGRIVVVGSNDDVRAIMGNSDGFDARGRTIVPGMIDAHLHFLGLSLDLNRVQLGGLTTIADGAALAGQRAAVTPPGEWVRGGGWNYNNFQDSRWPTKEDLDQQVPNHPVAFSSHDLHSLWVNSKTLELAGITRNTPDPVDGVIMRDANGEPSGMLLEGAMKAVREVIPQPTAEEKVEALRAGMRESNRLGLTGAGSMEQADALTALQKLRTAGEMTMRIYHSIPADSLDHALALGLRTGLGDEWLRLGHLKIFSDGTLGSRSASMLEPYAGEPDNYGIPVRTPENLRYLIRTAAANGIASCIHAIGDASNRLLLDIFEEAQADGLGPGLRHRIEHAQVLSPTDIGRFATLGVIPSMQPIHCTSDMFGIDRWWGDRGSFAFVFETLRRSGAVLAFGSDAPVDNLSPIAGIHAAVMRQNAAGLPAGGWYPAERLSTYHALEAYCSGAAYASGEENLKGTLEPGKLGDFVVLSQDLLTVPGEALLQVVVEATVVGGQVVYGQ